MTTIKDVYQDLDSDTSFEEFEEQVENKIEEMNGLVDKDAAAVLVSDGLTTGRVQNIEEIDAGMDEVEFLGKILTIGDLNTFSRDGEDSDGTVCNIEVGDETGQIRAALWDEMAEDAVEELEVGEVLEISGTPKDGYNGLEVSAHDVVVQEDVEIGIEALESYHVADLSAGLSAVTMKGLVLGTTSINTFERDDGSDGQVANIVIGDKTGEIQVTMWGEAAEAVDDYRVKQSVEVTNADVRDGDNGLELHISSPDDITHIKEQIKYIPETTPIGEAELGDSVNLAGGVTYLDEKRAFDRDDGSSGQVRNLNLEDDSGNIRVSLWGDKAEMDINVSDEILITNAEIEQGWEDEPEASTGYQSTVLITGRGSYDVEEDEEADEGEKDDSSSSSGSTKSIDEYESDGDDAGEEVQVAGTVLGVGEEITLDTPNGEITITGGSDFDVRLGQSITVRGTQNDDDSIAASEIF
ncbi:OB-fold nucleic acid binding domain-containing protein [Halosimplex pelagicum]|uniref:Replication factor A n=1 Tax=Halosimplex pelagicum TaxID=869886 RepID=A0A7D5T572_9EURY|nr:OB-fold nucleic acid binding domain-containing protein [Halosimplex pelagicum]QLH82108.1 replication factor A [Halosimplex pelagicum]